MTLFWPTAAADIQKWKSDQNTGIEKYQLSLYRSYREAAHATNPDTDMPIISVTVPKEAYDPTSTQKTLNVAAWYIEGFKSLLDTEGKSIVHSALQEARRAKIIFDKTQIEQKLAIVQSQYKKLEETLQSHLKTNEQLQQKLNKLQDECNELQKSLAQQQVHFQKNEKSQQESFIQQASMLQKTVETLKSQMNQEAQQYENQIEEQLQIKTTLDMEIHVLQDKLIEISKKLQQEQTLRSEEAEKSKAAQEIFTKAVLEEVDSFKETLAKKIHETHSSQLQGTAQPVETIDLSDKEEPEKEAQLESPKNDTLTKQNNASWFKPWMKNSLEVGIAASVTGVAWYFGAGDIASAFVSQYITLAPEVLNFGLPALSTGVGFLGIKGGELALNKATQNTTAQTPTLSLQDQQQKAATKLGSALGKQLLPTPVVITIERPTQPTLLVQQTTKKVNPKATTGSKDLPQTKEQDQDNSAENRPTTRRTRPGRKQAVDTTK